MYLVRHNPQSVDCTALNLFQRCGKVCSASHLLWVSLPMLQQGLHASLYGMAERPHHSCPLELTIAVRRLQQQGCPHVDIRWLHLCKFAAQGSALPGLLLCRSTMNELTQGSCQLSSSRLSVVVVEWHSSRICSQNRITFRLMLAIQAVSQQS